MTLFSNQSPETPVTLRRLVVLRWCLLAGELAAVLVVPPLLDIPLPRWPMLVVIVLQLTSNARMARRMTRTDFFVDGELFVQLVLDVFALSVLMFLSGGAANPLISLLLPPVAVAALALPPPLVAIMAGLAVTAYSALNILYLPLSIADAARAASLHLAGMWFTFVVSVGMLAWFVMRMAASIRQRDVELSAVREQALRDERVIALGALAAGAAHELSTPLATMAIVVGDLENDAELSEASRADVALIRTQISACKNLISQLAERAGAERLDSAAVVAADRWLAQVHARWLELRPHVRSDLHFAGPMPAPTIITDTRLEQGVVSLFNNAANTGSVVHVVVNWDDQSLSIEVRDDGPGFPPLVLEYAGRAPFPVHVGGSGIGLFLAQAATTRLGGQLILFNDNGGVAHIRLPVRPLL